MRIPAFLPMGISVKKGVIPKNATLTGGVMPLGIWRAMGPWTLLTTPWHSPLYPPPCCNVRPDITGLIKPLLGGPW